MGAYTAVTPTRLGAVVAGQAVAASDTLNVSILGTKGALVEIINAGASPDAVTVSDAGTTPAGTPGAPYSVSVTNGTNKILYVSPSQADTATGNVTFTHGLTTGVTVKVYPMDRP